MSGFSRLILIIIIFSLVSLCFADGMFKGAGAVVPGIPYQAGIIRYKDGEETLIIQSYMEAEEGDNFGWIIPLPEEPKEIKQFSSILLISFFLFIFHIIWMILKRNMKIPLIAYLISFLVILGLSAVYYKNCDTLDEFHMVIPEVSYGYPYRLDLKKTFSQYLENKDLNLASFTDEEIKELIMKNENEMISKNRITGEPVIFEDSPGNFTIERNNDGKRILIFYDVLGGTLEFDI